MAGALKVLILDSSGYVCTSLQSAGSLYSLWIFLIFLSTPKLFCSLGQVMDHMLSISAAKTHIKLTGFS